MFYGGFIIILVIMNNEIPTHDPQTGDINPFYQELTGQPNPLSCGPHLVWWNNLTNEKQHQLNYEYFGQPDLGETDFLTEKDIELIWKKETKEKYITEYVKSGKRLHGIHNVDTIRDGGTILLESYLNDRPKFYLHKNKLTLHSGYPTTDENIITDKPTKVYIMDCMENYLKRTKEHVLRIEKIVQKVGKII